MVRSVILIEKFRKIRGYINKIFSTKKEAHIYLLQNTNVGILYKNSINEWYSNTDSDTNCKFYIVPYDKRLDQDKSFTTHSLVTTKTIIEFKSRPPTLTDIHLQLVQLIVNCTFEKIC